MGKIQRTQGSGRLSEGQTAFIKKVAAAGSRHPEKRRRYVFLLVAALLWFYLLSFCKRHAAVLAAIMWIGMFAALFFATSPYMTQRGEEASDSDQAMLQMQQEQLGELRDEIYIRSGSMEPQRDFITALMAENADTVGWLTIPETDIDYPVMQTPGDDYYYLYRDFYGNENGNGSLFVAAGCDVEGASTNWIIRGQNMKSGAMFGGLLKYRKKDYMQEHNVIFLDTLEGRRTYEIVAVFESQVYDAGDEDGDAFKFYQCYDMDSRESFDAFYDNIRELALYDTGAEAAYGDRFITLFTDAYHTENGCFVVVGRELSQSSIRK